MQRKNRPAVAIVYSMDMYLLISNLVQVELPMFDLAHNFVPFGSSGATRSRGPRKTSVSEYFRLYTLSFDQNALGCCSFKLRMYICTELTRVPDVYVVHVPAMECTETKHALLSGNTYSLWTIHRKWTHFDWLDSLPLKTFAAEKKSNSVPLKTSFNLL